MRTNRFSMAAIAVAARALAALPYRWQMALGRFVGRRAERRLESRRRVTETNLRLCFPERSQAERDAQVVRVFESVGMTMFEIIIAWFMPRRRFDRLRVDYVGVEHFEAALATGRGVLLCCAHFAPGELLGRRVGLDWPVSGVIYEHGGDRVFDDFRKRKAAGWLARTIPHLDFKQMIRALRGGEVLWYLPDQDLGIGERVPSTFFDVPIQALSAPVRLARTGRALIVPALFNRLPNGEGYQAHFEPAYEPDGDVAELVRRWYVALEEHVRRHEDQYLWTHKMFKTRPPGEPPVYD